MESSLGELAAGCRCRGDRGFDGILEDDHDSEYRYESLPIAALQGLDRDSRFVYIGTFSMVLFPALRIGYVVIPAGLVPRLTAARESMDIFPPRSSRLSSRTSSTRGTSPAISTGHGSSIGSDGASSSTPSWSCFRPGSPTA